MIALRISIMKTLSYKMLETSRLTELAYQVACMLNSSKHQILRFLFYHPKLSAWFLPV